MSRVIWKSIVVIIGIIFLFIGPSATYTGLTYNLYTSVEPAGGGSVYPGVSKWEEGREVTLAANPSPGYVFDRWVGNASGTLDIVTITMDSDKTVTARFLKLCMLTALVSPAGGGSINPPGGGFFYGTSVTLNAQAAPGYRFDHWSTNAPIGSITGVYMPYSLIIRMDGDQTVTAHFIKKCTLVTSVSPEGGGSVTPAGGTYDEGTTVTITADPPKGYGFIRWEGDASGTIRTISITMDSDKTITAVFRNWSAPMPLPVPPLPGGDQGNL